MRRALFAGLLLIVNAAGASAEDDPPTLDAAVRAAPACGFEVDPARLDAAMKTADEMIALPSKVIDDPSRAFAGPEPETGLTPLPPPAPEPVPPEAVSPCSLILAAYGPTGTRFAGLVRKRDSAPK